MPIFLRTHNPRQNYHRNVVGEVRFDEILGENEKHVIGQWRRGGPCYERATYLDEL